MEDCAEGAYALEIAAEASGPRQQAQSPQGTQVLQSQECEIEGQEGQQVYKQQGGGGEAQPAKEGMGVPFVGSAGPDAENILDSKNYHGGNFEEGEEPGGGVIDGVYGFQDLRNGINKNQRNDKDINRPVQAVSRLPHLKEFVNPGSDFC